MLFHLTLIFACQLAGEVIARLLGLPVPGPVLGMVILFVALVIRGHVPDDVGVVTGGLLQNLSLLFVPAGVGVMLHAGLLVQNWLAVSAALMASVVITIAVTGLAMSWMKRFAAAGDEPEGQS